MVVNPNNEKTLLWDFGDYSNKQPNVPSLPVTTLCDARLAQVYQEINKIETQSEYLWVVINSKFITFVNVIFDRSKNIKMNYFFSKALWVLSPKVTYRAQTPPPPLANLFN